MQHRPVWEGHLRLSLVSCAVTLHKAVGEAERAVHFNLLHPETHNRVKQFWRDPEAGEVERRDLVRGFEVEQGRWVVVSDEELQAIRLESTKTIDIERFVAASDIDRLYWDQPYYLVPEGRPAAEPFAVIRAAMAAEARVGLGRLVMLNRERQVAIEVRGNGLLLTTLRAHDEVRDAAEVFDAVPPARVTKPMLEIARQIIAQAAGPFDASEFHDHYGEALRELVESKAAGAAPPEPKAPQAEGNVVDLMEALRRSLKGGGGQAKAPKPAAKPAKPAKAPAKRRTARRA